MANNKITITGSSGFIGSLLCEKLDIPLNNRFDIQDGPEGDILQPGAIKRIIQGIDTVVHLAAITGVKQCDENIEYVRKLNTDITLDLAKQAKREGVRRFIFASSSAVYGEATEYVIDERHPLAPRSTYGKTKLDAERIFKLKSADFEVVILRKSNVYGYGTKWKGYTVIDQFLESYLAKESIKVAGNGTQKRDFVHIMDVVRLYSEIAIREKIRSGIYNIGGPDTISIRGLADLVNEIGEAVFGYRVPIEKTDGGEGLGWHDFRYDCSKARMEFQYVPKFTLDDYLKERFLKALREKKSYG